MATTSTTTSTSISLSTNTAVPSTPRSTASSNANATKPSQRCTYPFCPIKDSHDRGLCLHSCCTSLSAASRRIFSPSVPPPNVLAACERCIRNDGTSTDEELWVTFHEVHVEPLLNHTDAVWVAPVPARGRDGKTKICERADARGVKDEAEESRHPFGLRNPPVEVWEAHRRLVQGGKGSMEDHNLVDAFAVKNAYYGNGLGKEESPPRCFQVRRPRYSPSLAKQRRVEKKSRSQSRVDQPYSS